MSNCCSEKPSVYAYTVATTPVLANAPIPFVEFRATGQTGRCVTLLNSNTIQIKKAGIYLINVSLTGSATDTAGGLITAQMTSNDVVYTGARASSSSSGIANIVNLGFNAVVEVKPSCQSIDNTTTIRVLNTGVGATYTTTNITVTRL